ncbi:hypothetical protein KEM52_003408, partial [Ascosphaera acerosa]
MSELNKRYQLVESQCPRVSDNAKAILATMDDVTLRHWAVCYADVTPDQAFTLDATLLATSRALNASADAQARAILAELSARQQAAASAVANDKERLPTRVRGRQLRDLPPGPQYGGTKIKAAAWHWLRACLDQFPLKEALTGIRLNSQQRVLVAASWRSDKARKAWESTRLAHQTNPATNSMPKTWEELERWLLHCFDELNVKDRLWDDFLTLRQTSDVQSYCAEFMLAYQLTKAKLDDKSLHRHLIKNLKPSLQQEWKRLQTKPMTWEDIGRELVRLEDVTASSKPTARATPATATIDQDGDAMDLDVLN